MTVLARFSVGAEDFELGQILAGTNAEISLTQLVPIEGRLTPYFWVTNDHDVDAFERGVRADPRVMRLEQLDRSADRTLYRIRWADGPDGLFQALAEQTIILENAQCANGTWTLQLHAADQDALPEFFADCREQEVPISVEQIVHNSNNHHNRNDPFGLTSKQHEALELAFSKGYFEVARRISQGELADHVGITRQAFARRLKRALQTVILHLLVEEQLPRIE